MKMKMVTCGYCGSGQRKVPDEKDLKRIRKEYGLKMKELAELHECSVNYISAVENGRKTPSKRLTQLYRALEKEVEVEKAIQSAAVATHHGIGHGGLDPATGHSPGAAVIHCPKRP